MGNFVLKNLINRKEKKMLKDKDVLLAVIELAETVVLSVKEILLEKIKLA